MGSFFSKCVCKNKPSLTEVESKEFYLKKFKSVDISVRIVKMSNNETRLKIVYLNYRRNISDLLKLQKQQYERINQARRPKKTSCLPFFIDINNRNSSLSLRCYEDSLYDIILGENNLFLESLKENLENIIENMIEELFSLSQIKIFHLNINPRCLFFQMPDKILLQNFRFPDVYNHFQDSKNDIYSNKFILKDNTQKSWQAPEIDSMSDINDEKIDIFAIGKFIEYMKPDLQSTLYRLYKSMILPDPNDRPSYKQCIYFLQNKGVLPPYNILKADLNFQVQPKSTKVYDCKKTVFTYFDQHFELLEITVKLPNFLPRFRQYIENMKKLSDLSEKNGCFLKVYRTEEESNEFRIITEHCFKTMKQKILSKEELFSNNELWDMFIPLLYVVERFTKLGIFHGNICLENLKINDEGFLKITGFLFFAEEIDEDPELFHILEENRILAPEVRKNPKALSDQQFDFGKADVYSLGITMVEIVTNTERTNMHLDNRKKMNKFIDKQNNINEELKKTLEIMIEVEPEKRNNITSCIKFLPVESKNPKYESIQIN